MCCPLVNVDELNQVLIDTCCTAEVLNRNPPNLYEMDMSIAALNAPIDISIVQRVCIHLAIARDVTMATNLKQK